MQPYKIRLSIWMISINVILSKALPTTSPQNPGDLIKCNPVKGIKPWCGCRASDTNMIIDLSSFGAENKFNSGELIRKPSFIAQHHTTKWYIAWSPCNDFDIFNNNILNPEQDDHACKDVGFARFTNNSNNDCQSYGSHQTSASIESNGRDGNSRIRLTIVFQYTSPNGTPRKAKIKLKCHQGKTHTLTYNRDDNLEIATFSSKCCCEGGCTHASPPPLVTKPDVPLIAGLSGVGLIVVVAILVVIIKRKHEPNYPVQVEGEQNERDHLI